MQLGIGLNSYSKLKQKFRLDFCSDDDESCETLGLAKMGGMCDPESSCNVNQNTGLSLAFTIAHEMGHK